MPTDEKGTQIQSSQAIADTDLFFTVHDVPTTPITKTKTGKKVKQWLAYAWTEVEDTWTYASASAINIPSDGILIYQKGDKLRFKQGGGYKYAVIRSVTATLITILVNTDYTVANSAITNIAFSRNVKPFGFPDKFNFTPAVTYTGGTTNPTSFTLAISYWRVIGADFLVTISGSLVKGSGDRTNIVFSIPITVAAISILPGMDSITAAGLSLAACYAFVDGNIYYQRTMANNGDIYINGSLVFS